MKTYSRKKGDSPSNVIIHVNELCRLCLAKEEEMVPIYDDDAVPLPLRIMACVNLEVNMRKKSKNSRCFFSIICDTINYISRGLRYYLEDRLENRNLVYP